MAPRRPLGELDSNAAPGKVRNTTKPGPKPKALQDRIYKPRPPIHRPRKTYSRERKIECLMMRFHHKVPVYYKYSEDILRYRQPTWDEIGKHFGGIPEANLQRWWKEQDTILGSKKGSRRYDSTWHCSWPNLEEKLYNRFATRRANNQPVRRSWFRKNAIELYKEEFPEGKLFCFSVGWFQGFCKRSGIVLRVVTHQVCIII